MRLVIRMSQVDSEDKESAAPIFQLASPSSPASLSSAVGDFEMLERTAKSEPAASVPGDVPPSDDLAAELASRQWEGGTTDTAAAPVPSAPVAEAATDTAAATDAEAPVAIGQTKAAAHQLRKRDLEEVLEESERRGDSASDGSIQRPAAPDSDEALPLEDLDPDSPETAVLVPSANIMRFPTMNMDGTTPLPSAPARGELAYAQKPSVAEAADDDELAAIIREALAAIASTDAAPDAADEGQGISGAERGGASGRPKSWVEWEEFRKRVEKGESYLSVAVDFRFTDGGRLRGDSAQMDRMYCFHDPAETDDSTMLDVVHAHTTSLWKDRALQLWLLNRPAFY